MSEQWKKLQSMHILITLNLFICLINLIYPNNVNIASTIMFPGVIPSKHHKPKRYNYTKLIIKYMILDIEIKN